MGETAKIAEALAAFQAEMPTVAKTKRANLGNYSYTYADLADVAEAALPRLTDHGLSFVATPRRTEQGGYELAGLLLHSSGERLEGALPINGRTPQEIGSSLTYSRRYLFGCMTGIVTDDDDDGNLAQRAAKKQQAKPKPQPQQQDTGEAVTPKTRAHMFALFSQKGVAEEQQLPGINHITGKDYTSRGDITELDAKRVIEVLKARPDAPKGSEQ